LIVLAVLAAGGWYTRDLWLPARYRQHAVIARTPPQGWEGLSDSGAMHTRVALARLGQKTGPVYQTLSGADAASYVFRQIAQQMPPSTDSIQAMVKGDRVAMRAKVKVSELGGPSALGSVARMLGEREWVQLSGNLRVAQPGLAEFQVQDVKIGELPSLPRGTIPAVIKRLEHGARPASPALDADALPLPIPRYVGEIRVANGKITLYKNMD
jgi:hypothetical protein